MIRYQEIKGSHVLMWTMILEKSLQKINLTVFSRLTFLVSNCLPQFYLKQFEKYMKIYMYDCLCVYLNKWVYSFKLYNKLENLHRKQQQ